MKIIAIEEAFSMEDLAGVPKTSGYTGIDPERMDDWMLRGPDFTRYRIPDMDANGVNIHVLSLTAPGIQAIPDGKTAVASAMAANNYLASVIANNPDRFRGFAALPMQVPEAAADELRRCVTELGFCGALINDTTQGHYLDEPQYEPVWQALEETGAPLYLHPGPRVDQWSLMEGRPELGRALWEWQAQVGGHAMRLIFAGVFHRHPNARIIVGHMGEFLPFQTWRFDSRYAILAERALKQLPSAYFGKNVFITTSGVFSSAALLGAVMSIGEDAILFAIDYPYESTAEAVQFLRTAAISETAREKIAWRNAERLLRLE